jgi:hypothetical protein
MDENQKYDIQIVGIYMIMEQNVFRYSIKLIPKDSAIDIWPAQNQAIHLVGKMYSISPNRKLLKVLKIKRKVLDFFSL